jgi:pimeloyl-ACP methyl ester carboxylesterase
LLGTSQEYFDAHQIEIAQSIPSRCTDAGTRGAIAAQLRCLLDAGRAGSDRMITAPTLVLAGEYDSLIPNCYGRQLAVEIVDGQFSLLKGCGHNPVAEQPQKLAEKLKRFLDEAAVPQDAYGA